MCSAEQYMHIAAISRLQGSLTAPDALTCMKHNTCVVFHGASPLHLLYSQLQSCLQSSRVVLTAPALSCPPCSSSEKKVQGPGCNVHANQVSTGFNANTMHSCLSAKVPDRERREVHAEHAVKTVPNESSVKLIAWD